MASSGCPALGAAAQNANRASRCGKGRSHRLARSCRSRLHPRLHGGTERVTLLALAAKGAQAGQSAQQEQGGAGNDSERGRIPAGSRCCRSGPKWSEGGSRAGPRGRPLPTTNRCRRTRTRRLDRRRCHRRGGRPGRRCCPSRRSPTQTSPSWSPSLAIRTWSSSSVHWARKVSGVKVTTASIAARMLHGRHRVAIPVVIAFRDPVECMESLLRLSQPSFRPDHCRQCAGAISQPSLDGRRGFPRRRTDRPQGWRR